MGSKLQANPSPANQGNPLSLRNGTLSGGVGVLAARASDRTRPADYGVRMAVKWLDDPEDHDYDAAADYLSLISEADADRRRRSTRSSPRTPRCARPRTSCGRPGWTLLPATNARVKTDLAKIDAGKKLSPILLVRGKAARRRRTADRRRLPPRVRELPDRREHPDPVPSGVVADPGLR